MEKETLVHDIANNVLKKLNKYNEQSFTTISLQKRTRIHIYTTFLFIIYF